MQKQQPNKNTLFTCGEVRDIYLADGPCKRFSPRITLSKELPRVIAMIMIVITPSGQAGPSTLNQKVPHYLPKVLLHISDASCATLCISPNFYVNESQKAKQKVR